MTTSPRTRRTLMLFAATLAATAFALLLDGRAARPHGVYDAIVVAGCRLRRDGSPGEALARRVRRAAHLHAVGVAPIVVTTGGREPNGFIEADAAAEHAIALGVPASAIRRERASTSTEENATYAAALLGRDARVVVVTDDYHVFRARRVFARYFARADASGVVGPFRSKSVGLARELGAVTLYAAFGRL